MRAVGYFCAWCQRHRILLERVEPTIVAMYIQELMHGRNERTGKPYADASLKQHLAAVRMLFDYLTTGGVVPFNPASSVRGPKVVVEKGKTPVLSAADARRPSRPGTDRCDGLRVRTERCKNCRASAESPEFLKIRLRHFGGRCQDP